MVQKCGGSESVMLMLGWRPSDFNQLSLSSKQAPIATAVEIPLKRFWWSDGSLQYFFIIVVCC